MASLLDKVSTVGSYELPTDDWGESGAWLANIPALSEWEATQEEGGFHNVLHGLFVSLAEPVWRRGGGEDLFAALSEGEEGRYEERKRAEAKRLTPRSANNDDRTPVAFGPLQACRRCS